MSDPTTRLAAIRARWAAATPGPWSAARQLPSQPDEDHFLGYELTGPAFAGTGELARRADAEAIAAAPEDVAFLVDFAEEQQREIERLRAGVDFLHARQVHDGSGIRLDGKRCRGISADALAWYGVGVRDEPGRDEYPRDNDDLAACERTADMAPWPIFERMRPVLDKYRASLKGETNA